MPDSNPATGPLSIALGRLAAGEPLAETLAMDAFGQLMRGEASPAQAAAFLMALRVRGETGEEVAGAARALRDVMVRVTLPDGVPAIDTCGTGGGAVSTFNVSTAAALIAVGAGATVAKHGNRSYTTKCGSADVLEALGVNIAIDADRAGRLLERARIAFLFAPAFHPAMRFVIPVRRELAVPTIMNLLGPLANPASVRRQVIGVGDASRASLVADALRRLGVEHALVVHADVGMDEIAPAGRTAIWEVRGHELQEWSLEPTAFGLEEVDLRALQGQDPPANADRIARLFEQPGGDPAGRNAVLLNAGAALYVSGLADSLGRGIELATSALDEGRAAEALACLVRESRVSTSA